MKTGMDGEDRAACHLVSCGYEILQRNYRNRLGEIDIIACRDGMLVFVEVKTRKNLLFGSPSEAVHHRKQSRLHTLALCYMKEKGLSESPCRFDVISIVLESSSLEHIENAF